MKFHKSLFVLFFALALFVVPTKNAFADHVNIPGTESSLYSLFSFFDLRDRETFVQVTNTDSSDRVVHVQIFNVDQNCNENNFFDSYTPSDTHVYDMRDIQSNDGNPSGVVLPNDAYGFIVVSVVDSDLVIDDEARVLIGNFRVLDNSGYEYRTNSNGQRPERQNGNNIQPENRDWYFNFNTEGGVLLSDVIAINTERDQDFSISEPDIKAADLTSAYKTFDVEILNLDEVVFSCRNVIFSCVDQDNPRLEELLEFAANDDDGGAGANVASFEYGINEAIPHSKGGELLCPGNTTSEGFVRLRQDNPSTLVYEGQLSAFFIGLNNGNGRGSMDSWWAGNDFSSGN